MAPPGPWALAGQALPPIFLLNHAIAPRAASESIVGLFPGPSGYSGPGGPGPCPRVCPHWARRAHGGVLATLAHVTVLAARRLGGPAARGPRFKFAESDGLSAARWRPGP
jgi:hypothetical protein